MRNRLIQIAALLALVAVTAYGPATARLAGAVETAPSLSSIGPLAFGPDGMLYAADPQAATIFALDLGAQANGGAAGTANVAGLDQKLAAMLGTAAGEIQITDLAVHPKTHNSFVSVMRGQGAAAKPALFRVDGAGKIDLVASESLKSTSVTLPNPRPPARPTAATTGASRSPSWRSRTAASGWPGCRTRSSRRSCGRWRIRSRKRTPARASRSTTATTSSSRPARRCTRSSRTRSTTSPTSSARISARRWSSSRCRR